MTQHVMQAPMKLTLIKQAIAELRKCQGDVQSTRRCMLTFIQNGLIEGYTIDVIITTLGAGPDSILRRVPYSDAEVSHLVHYLKTRTIAELVGEL
jgi:hypothetical protein